MQIDVFISYARENREIADKLANVLTNSGLSVWHDVDLMPGNNFQREIEAVIDRSKLVVVLWSKYSDESGWVNWEADLAHKQNKLFHVIIGDRETPPPKYFKEHAFRLENNSKSYEQLSDKIVTFLKDKTTAGIDVSQASNKTQPREEAEYWLSISTNPNQNVGEYQIYLQKYGSSALFSELAEVRIKEIKNAKKIAKKLPAIIGMTSALILAILGGLQIYDRFDLPHSTEETIETKASNYDEVVTEDVLPPDVPEAIETPPVPEILAIEYFGKYYTNITSPISVAISPDNTTLAVAGYEGANGERLELIDIQTKSILPAKFEGINAGLYAVEFSANGSSVFVGGQEGGVVRSFSISGGRPRWSSFPFETDVDITELLLTENGNTLLTIGSKLSFDGYANAKAISTYDGEPIPTMSEKLYVVDIYEPRIYNYNSSEGQFIIFPEPSGTYPSVINPTQINSHWIPMIAGPEYGLLPAFASQSQYQDQYYYFREGEFLTFYRAAEGFACIKSNFEDISNNSGPYCNTEVKIPDYFSIKLSISPDGSLGTIATNNQIYLFKLYL